jgi:hypothetical protein
MLKIAISEIIQYKRHKKNHSLGHDATPQLRTCPHSRRRDQHPFEPFSQVNAARCKHARDAPDLTWEFSSIPRYPWSASQRQIWSPHDRSYVGIDTGRGSSSQIAALFGLLASCLPRLGPQLTWSNGGMRQHAATSRSRS